MFSNLTNRQLDPQAIREKILAVAEVCKSPTHLGASMGIVEILVALFGGFPQDHLSGPDRTDADEFILSKGHGYLGLLATMCEGGILPYSELITYQTLRGGFGAHPVLNDLPGLISSNGSLGHGLPYAAGLAVAKKMKGEKGVIYVLMGDGECSEGSVLEAALIIPSLKITNVVAIIDANGFGNDGDIAYGDVDKISQAFKGFGWSVMDADGHDVEMLRNIFSTKTNSPLAVFARTVKGKGIPEIEGSNESHHMKYVRKSFPNE